MYLSALYLVFATFTLVHARPNSTGSQCTSGPVKDTRCRVECGVDYPGGDYAQQAVSSFSACISLCNKDSQCVDAQYHRDNKYCYLKNRLTTASANANVDSILCSGGGTTTTKTTTTTTSTSKTTTKTTTKTSTATSSPTSCASGIFKIEITLKTGETDYFLDFKSNPSFVSETYDITAAGQYTLTGTTLNSVAVPGAIVYSISGFGPGPNPPPNSRALYEGIPGTLDSSTGENLPIQVTVVDQATCRLAFTDGVRTVIGVAGFRGGPSVYIAPPGTTTNFNEAVLARAVKV